MQRSALISARIMLLIVLVVAILIFLDYAKKYVGYEDVEQQIVALIEAEPYTELLGNPCEAVLQSIIEEPLIFDIPEDGTRFKRTAYQFSHISFTCERGKVNSISLNQGEFLGISLGSDYDVDQIIDILGHPDEEGSWDITNGEGQMKYMTYYIKKYQIIFYPEETLSVQFGKEF